MRIIFDPWVIQLWDAFAPALGAMATAGVILGLLLYILCRDMGGPWGYR